MPLAKKRLDNYLSVLTRNGEGGNRLRSKWEGMTQHGKDFSNRVVNTTTQGM